MPREDRKGNPSAMIGVGICFMAAGVALSFALRESGSAPVGIGLISLGLIFFAVGAGAKRKAKPGESGGAEDERPPA